RPLGGLLTVSLLALEAEVAFEGEGDAVSAVCSLGTVRCVVDLCRGSFDPCLIARNNLSNGPGSSVSAGKVTVPISKIDIIKTRMFCLGRLVVFLSALISPSRCLTNPMFLGRPHAKFSSFLHRFA